MKYAALVLVVICAVIAAGIFLDNDPRLYSHDLGCEDYDGRAQQICQGLSREMEWEWLGHAIVAPGWRVTFRSMRQVYCGERIMLEDIGTLKDMLEYSPRHSMDWRLDSGISGLLTLIHTSPEARAAKVPDSLFDVRSGTVYSVGANSVFSPENPAYILRGGCPK